LTETQAKTLEANFSDSMKPNRNFADELKADKTKNREFEKTPPLKTILNF
jgi:hypothetical protein